MGCGSLHTVYQPNKPEERKLWECPGCKSSEISIQESDRENESCEKLHIGDKLYCSTCKVVTSGMSFSSYMRKKWYMRMGKHF